MYWLVSLFRLLCDQSKISVFFFILWNMKCLSQLHLSTWCWNDFRFHTHETPMDGCIWVVQCVLLLFNNSIEHIENENHTHYGWGMKLFSTAISDEYSGLRTITLIYTMVYHRRERQWTVFKYPIIQKWQETFWVAPILTVKLKFITMKITIIMMIVHS